MGHSEISECPDPENLCQIIRAGSSLAAGRFKMSEKFILAGLCMAQGLLVLGWVLKWLLICAWMLLVHCFQACRLAFASPSN